MSDSNNCFLYQRCNHKDCDKDFCMRKYKLSALYDAALISEKLRKPFSLALNESDALDRKDVQSFTNLKMICNHINEFVSAGENLFLHSSISGNGKTSWSIRIAHSYLDSIWFKAPLECKVLFINVPSFLLALKENISDKNEQALYIKQNYLEADLVIWDDIAAKVGSEFEINHLLSMIDNRISLGKSNIFTSNLNKEQMMTALGSRLTSRICNLSIDIELFGSDKRSWAKGGFLSGINKQ